MHIAPIIGIIAAAAATSVAGCSSTNPKDPLIGTTWQLLSIESMSSEQPSTTIETPSEYTVTFGDDGQAGFRVDCNRGNSTWKAEAAAADSGTLTFGPIGLTKMMCPQPSDDSKVAAALGRVRSYLLSDGKLHLSLEVDSGIMHWEPMPTGK
jgi:para-nitrobenzyl esterase